MPRLPQDDLDRIANLPTRFWDSGRALTLLSEVQRARESETAQIGKLLQAEQALRMCANVLLALNRTEEAALVQVAIESLKPAPKKEAS